MSDASRPPGYAPWSLHLGKRADPTRVIAKENWQRGGQVALITFPAGRKKSTNTGIVVRTAGGKIDRRREKQVEILMDAAHRALINPPPPDAEPDIPLTIGETERIITDAATGLYPIASAHRSETLRHLTFAASVWGHARPWDTIKRPDWTALGRAVVNHFAARAESAKPRRHAKSQNNATDAGGYDSAVKCVKRVYTVAVWLADNEHIDAIPARPKKWLEDLKAYWVSKNGAVSVPKPKAPRHSLDEMRKILTAMRDVDPRGYLLLALGAELRAGQVARAMRSWLTLEASDTAPYGMLTVYGKGKKKGEVSYLTKGQRAVVDEALGESGYLRHFEGAYGAMRVTDYPLFPGGKLRTHAGAYNSGKRVPAYVPLGERVPVGRRAMIEWFHDAEGRADVRRSKGRAYYGLRRVNVDEVLNRENDPRVLQSSGGWSSAKVPTEIYAERDSVAARRKAMDVRANIRGE